jgi:uncharacterized protein (TIGR03085 family)
MAGRAAGRPNGRIGSTIWDMPRYAQMERRTLADLLLAVGPDAPTINEGWRSRDLAAHLVVRERRPDAAAGILLKPLRGHSERVQAAVAAQPYPRLVDQVRRSPWWSPVSNRLTDELANLLEFFIHHEDLRRAQPDWRPRESSRELTAALWRRLPAVARLTLRRFPGAVLVQAPGHGELSTGAGGEPLRLVGDPGELALFLFGRQRVARVQLDGPPTLTERLRTARLGV